MTAVDFGGYQVQLRAYVSAELTLQKIERDDTRNRGVRMPHPGKSTGSAIIVLQDRDLGLQQGPGLGDDRPRTTILAQSGANRRSIVAADVVTSNPAAASGMSSSSNPHESTTPPTRAHSMRRRVEYGAGLSHRPSRVYG